MFKLIVFILFINGIRGFCESHRTFPDGFKFGTATAAYQIEGGWNASDKGENIWDRFSHSIGSVHNSDTGDEACNSYHQYERDVEMLKELGVDFYRFSLSWSRILPTGFDNKISVDGIAYYNKLIDLLIENGITPIITLYHWDLPQPLQDISGWTNPLLANYFKDYARVCFEAFGDRVKTWLTINEPNIFCRYGYGSNRLAPGVNAPGVGEYLCGHTVLKAHAKAYHLYYDEYRAVQKGRIGLTIHSMWYEPEDPTSSSDQLASETAMQNQSTVVPWGLKNLLIWIKNTYDNPEVLIFENGFSDLGGTADDERVDYYSEYLNAMLDAVEEGCHVTAYTAWSLMDNFEWDGGYRQRFGIFYVDFESPDKKRTIKDSGKQYAEIIATKTLEKGKSSFCPARPAE